MSISVKYLIFILLTISVVSVNGFIRKDPLKGSVMAFDIDTCPRGWEKFTDADGRYIVAVINSSNTGDITGTKLTDLENRQVGKHNHSVTDPGHKHIIQTGLAETGSFMDGNNSGTQSSNDTLFATPSSYLSIDNAGSITGTNAPYIQVLWCKRT